MIIITIKVHVLGEKYWCLTWLFNPLSKIILLYHECTSAQRSAMRVGLCGRSRTSNLLSQRLLHYKPLNTSARVDFLEYTWGPYTENSNFFVNTKILQKAVKKKKRKSWTNRDYEKCTLEPLLAGYSPNISWSRSSELKITFYSLTVAQQAI